MNEDNLPSLLQMSAAEVAITVLNNPEIRDLINSYVLPAPSSKKVHFRSTVETKTEEKISKLSLPPVLKNAVKCSMRPMISQMSDWKQSYGSVLKECTGFFTDASGCFRFFWKHNGQIDHQKTAKALVENQNVDIRERFMLACSLCLIDEGEHIWNSMTPGQKGFILLERGRFPALCSAAVNIFIKALEVYREWAGKTTYKRISDLILLSPVIFHNLFLLRHVLDIEPQKTHRRYLLNAARSVGVNTDMMRFCLSRLSRRDQRTIFRRLSARVRRRFRIIV
ncbi:hypothetical protein AVEN_1193-1 [Araneus ventricosus]|uniref:Uncharacterized protein n=1 Tax=Araneus ventricosus TaxID=182803 RepID=A0A4Y2RPR6_ARAVE|nr:hypothetical protein AVEN_274801-1 [Araneus ventricosus]GBN77342.1 hypothetical protein AVEN_131489-1 [Araneus ventricosus]GBN77375.1 hypothetical protein AVEN_190143-1 [Araneus ventricosus]GBN77380.1 hypothetical protein AVEN_1193-1 [Araneus ventricosus]